MSTEQRQDQGRIREFLKTGGGGQGPRSRSVGRWLSTHRLDACPAPLLVAPVSEQVTVDLAHHIPNRLLPCLGVNGPLARHSCFYHGAKVDAGAPATNNKCKNKCKNNNFTNNKWTNDKYTNDTCRKQK